MPVGVAVESAGAEAGRGRRRAGGAETMRLVVFGDSDFATNQLLQANVGNAVLLANALNWLVEREALLGIPPKKTEQVRLNLTGAQLRGVVLLAVLGAAAPRRGAGHLRSRCAAGAR